MSCDEQVEEAQREVLCLSRHEPVPQPKGQSASRPERLVTQPSPDYFSRPRASRSSSRGRGVGLVFLWGALSFLSLLSFFRAGFPGVVWKQGVRSGHFGHPGSWPGWLCRISLQRSGSSRLERAVAPRAQCADPRTEHLFRYPPSVFGTLLGIAVFFLSCWIFWVFGSLLHQP